MGLISRVSSRTYRDSQLQLKPVMENKVMTTSDDDIDDGESIVLKKCSNSNPQITLTSVKSQTIPNANSLPAKISLSESTRDSVSPKKSKSAASNIGSLFRRPSLTKKVKTHRRLKSVEISPIEETPKIVKQSATTNCLDKQLSCETATSEPSNPKKSASLPRDYKEVEKSKNAEKLKNAEKCKNVEKSKNLDKSKIVDKSHAKVVDKSKGYEKSKSKKFY